jgi:hypothetical protein
MNHILSITKQFLGTKTRGSFLHHLLVRFAMDLEHGSSEKETVKTSGIDASLVNASLTLWFTLRLVSWHGSICARKA